MAKKYTIHLTWLLAIVALTAVTVLLTAPSWSSPARLFVTTPAPEDLPLSAGTTVTLSGDGLSQASSLWLVPESSIRSAATVTLETFGDPHHFIQRDDRLYVANWSGGFFMVQGLQSPHPSISGILDSAGQGMEITLRQDEALMAAGTGGLQIIDIRDAANPQLLAELKSLTPALSVASAGKIAYVATGKQGMQIVDLSDPRNPRQLGQLPNLPDVFKVFSDENLLFVATASGGWIYDISQPEQPRRLVQLPVPGGVITVMTRHKETLYWATKTGRVSSLVSIDLRQPESPRLLSSLPLNGPPRGISYSDGCLAVAVGSNGTQLFSPTGPSRLTPLHSIAAKNRSHFALVLGSDLWVGDGYGELLRLDITEGAALYQPPILPDFFSRITPLVTSQLFLLADQAGIAIYFHEEETTPVLLARLAITGLMQQYLATDQRHLWLAIRDPAPRLTGKLLCVDISTSHAPRIMAEIPFPRPPIIIGESGTTLVSAIAGHDRPDFGQAPNPPLNGNLDKAKLLHFIDISQPESPALLGNYSLATSSSAMKIDGQSLVLMQEDGLFRVIDLSDVHSPKELGSLQMPWLEESAWSYRVNIAIHNHVAFLASPLAKVIAIDFTDPRHPKNLGGFTLDGPVTALLLSDHFLLAQIVKQGLAVVDLNKPLQPEVLGMLPLPGSQHNCAVHAGNLWYILPEAPGLWSLPLPRRLQTDITSHTQIRAHLQEQPLPGAYRFWLTDRENHLVVPGITWIGSPARVH